MTNASNWGRATVFYHTVARHLSQSAQQSCIDYRKLVKFGMPKNKPYDVSPMKEAEDMLLSVGARITNGRVGVLAVLIKSERALTHNEVEECLKGVYTSDRVTIYRILEWLTTNDLAHKISGEDRVWRFTAERHTHGEQHAHFKCNDCGKVICLDRSAASYKVRLPAGFRSQQVELTINGLCSACRA